MESYLHGPLRYPECGCDLPLGEILLVTESQQASFVLGERAQCLFGGDAHERAFERGLNGGARNRLRLCLRDLAGLPAAAPGGEAHRLVAGDLK